MMPVAWVLLLVLLIVGILNPSTSWAARSVMVFAGVMLVWALVRHFRGTPE